MDMFSFCKIYIKESWSIINTVLSQRGYTRLATMKTIIVLAMCLAAALAIPADTYNPEYDNFNAKELVENSRLLKNYGKCFLNKGPCTPEGSDFKKVIPEALRTNCAKCSPKQRELIRTVVRGFQKDLPELWEELVKQEDPNGEYKEAFEKFLNGSD